jgi:hypothetical protein
MYRKCGKIYMEKKNENSGTERGQLRIPKG